MHTDPGAGDGQKRGGGAIKIRSMKKIGAVRRFLASSRNQNSKTSYHVACFPGSSEIRGFTLMFDEYDAGP